MVEAKFQNQGPCNSLLLPFLLLPFLLPLLIGASAHGGIDVSSPHPALPSAQSWHLSGAKLLFPSSMFSAQPASVKEEAEGFESRPQAEQDWSDVLASPGLTKG